MNDRRENEPQGGAPAGLGHERYEEMASAFVLGALEEPELSEFRRHLGTNCGDCAHLHPDLEAVARALLFAVEQSSPPPSLRERIVAAARAPALINPTRGRRREPLYAALALAASLALALASWRAFDLRGELATALRRAGAAESEVARLAGEISRLRTTADEQAALIGLLRRPSSGLVTLAALKPTPASGRVLWDPQAARGFLWVLGLPPDPEGKDYQLWAIIEGKPMSVGVFSVATDGSALVPLGDLSPDRKVGAFAITLEPAGGLPAPSGEILLVGQTGV